MRQNRADPRAALLLGVISLVGMPYAVLMPIFADQILHGGARGLGILMGATGVGALLGALTLALPNGACSGLGRWWRGGRRIRREPDRVFALAVFWLSVLLLVPVGFAMMVQMASSNTLIQSDGARRIARARDGRLHDDVHGHGSAGIVFAGVVAHHLGAPLTLRRWSRRDRAGCHVPDAVDGISVGARQLVMAQGMPEALRRSRLFPDGAAAPPFSGED